jgi:NADH-quinone oxidoreductase subunit E
MSTRHLAPTDIQPATFAFSADNQAWAEKTIARYPTGRQASAVIPILWRAQEQQGWVTRAAIEAVAKMLGMAYIRVLEIATFYTQFLLKPVGAEAHIIVCGTTPCMLRGAGDLIEVCQHKIAHDGLEVSADGKLSWEEAECLGACVNAPMVMIGNDTYEDLTAERFEEIVEAFRTGNGKSIKPGTQIDRQFSAAEGGATTLLEKPTAERTYKPFPPPPPPAAPAATVPAPPAPAAPPVPTAAPPAPAPAAEAKATATDPSPTPDMPGRKLGSVPAESAPAVKGPTRARKVSVEKADAERANANDAAKANGTPNDAMREGATGAESPAGKIDGGKAPRKPRAKKTPPPEGTA